VSTHSRHAPAADQCATSRIVPADTAARCRSHSIFGSRSLVHRGCSGVWRLQATSPTLLRHTGMMTANDTTLPRTTGGAPTTLLADLHAAALDRLGDEAKALKLERAVIGVFFTGVKLSNGASGLCATPIKSAP